MGKDGKFLPDGPDPEKTNNPASDFTFSVSYGDPQPVRVLAKRDLNGDGTADAGHAQVPDHAERRRPARADRADEPVERRRARRGRRLLLPRHAGRRHRHAAGRLREGVVHRRRPDERLVHVLGEGRVDEPRARARGGGLHRASRRSTSRTRGRRTSRTTSTRWPRPATPPTSTTSTRTAARRRARSASSRTTTRSIWYTGDDVITREPGMVPGTASRLANDEMLAVRAYLNEGGRLLYTGKYAGLADRAGLRVQPRDERPVRPGQRGRRLPGACRTTSCSTTSARTSTTRTRERRRRGRSTTSIGVGQSVHRRSAGRSARRARTTRTPRRRSSRRAGSCRRRSSRSSTAGRRRSTCGRAGRSTRTPARTTRTRTSRTSATSA